MQKIFPWRRGRMPRSAAQDPSLVLERLRQVDIFQGLGEDDVHAIFKMVTVRECVRGTVFFTPEDPSERLYILKYGKVELYRLTPSGKRLVTRRIGLGTVFGEMSLLGQGMTGTFAEAVEPSLVCVATREDVVGFLRQRPDVALRLLEAMGQRLRTLEEQLEHSSFSPVRERLVRFLLANAEPGTGVVSGYTQADIGDTIGALRQTVTETLSEMAAQGLVQVGHKRIRIMDRERLRQIAEGQE